MTRPRDPASVEDPALSRNPAADACTREVIVDRRDVHFEIALKDDATAAFCFVRGSVPRDHRLSSEMTRSRGGSTIPSSASVCQEFSSVRPSDS